MIMVDLNKELSKHEETHEKAKISNANIEKTMRNYLRDIELLAKCSAKDIETLLPPITDVPINTENLKELEKLLDKVEEMKSQRSTLEHQLREAMNSDDVLKKVIAHPKEEIDEVIY